MGVVVREVWEVVLEVVLEVLEVLEVVPEIPEDLIIQLLQLKIN